MRSQVANGSLPGKHWRRPERRLGNEMQPRLGFPDTYLALNEVNGSADRAAGMTAATNLTLIHYWGLAWLLPAEP